MTGAGLASRDRRPAQLPLQPLDLVSRVEHGLPVACRQGLVAPGLQVGDLRLDPGLVDPHHLVVGVGLDAHDLAQHGQQLVLVHGEVAVQIVVIAHLLGDLAQLGYRLLVQLVPRVVRHSSLLKGRAVAVDLRFCKI
jgi:hypothetical protein